MCNTSAVGAFNRNLSTSNQLPISGWRLVATALRFYFFTTKDPTAPLKSEVALGPLAAAKSPVIGQDMVIACFFVASVAQRLTASVMEEESHAMFTHSRGMHSSIDPSNVATLMLGQQSTTPLARPTAHVLIQRCSTMRQPHCLGHPLAFMQSREGLQITNMPLHTYASKPREPSLGFFSDIARSS